MNNTVQKLLQCHRGKNYPSENFDWLQVLLETNARESPHNEWGSTW